MQSRDQRRVATLAVDARTGETHSLSLRTDDVWIDLIDGAPRRAGGRLVEVAGAGDAVALCIDGTPVTPAGLEVRAVLAATTQGCWFTASTDPTEVHVWRWTPGRGRGADHARTGGAHRGGRRAGSA